jgi:hypothetical protein
VPTNSTPKTDSVKNERHEQNGKAATDDAARQVEELRDGAVAGAAKLVELHLAATEQATETLADLYLKAADATKLDTVSEIARAQADVVRKLSDLYVSTTRELLSR